MGENDTRSNEEIEKDERSHYSSENVEAQNAGDTFDSFAENHKVIEKAFKFRDMPENEELEETMLETEKPRDI